MARRRSRRKKQRGGPKSGPETTPGEPTPEDRPDDQAPADGEGATTGGPLVPWRTRMTEVQAAVRAWSRLHYAEAIDAWLRERFEDPDAPEHVRDVDQAIDDFVCSVGSSGDDPSILAVWCGQAETGQLAEDDGGGTDPETVAQARRWERERHRGVFLLQRGQRDQLALWDPLEGAPLTLHLLSKLPAREAEALVRGTVVTAVYQPWMARLVAVGTEYFTDPRAIQLFREQTLEAERAWHEAPAAAPAPTRKKTSPTS